MKKLLSILLAAVLVMSLATVPAFAQEKQKLVVAYNDNQDRGENFGQYQWLVNTFENWALKDKYELVIQAEPVNDSDFFTKMQLQMSDASTSPDIVLYDTFQLQADVAAGYFLKLDDYVAKWDAWNDGSIYEATKAGTTSADGSVYGVPSDTDTRGLWYNKNVFEKAGLGREWQPETWQDILDACEAIKANCEEDVIPMWMSGSAVEAEATTMNSYLMFHYGTGERLVDDATGIWNINTQGMYDSLSFFSDLYQKGFGGTMSEVIDANAWATMSDYLRNDKLGICLGGNWQWSNFAATGTYPWEGFEEELGFAKMPNQNGGGFTTLSGGWCLTIPAKCDVPDDAFDFLTNLMDPEQNYLQLILARGDLATRTELNEMEEYSAAPFMALATSYLDFTAYRPANENYSTVSSYIYTAVEEVVTGAKVEDAMAGYATKVTNLVGADHVKDVGFQAR